MDAASKDSRLQAGRDGGVLMQRMVGWRPKLKDSLQFCAAAGMMAVLIIPLTLAAIGLWIYVQLPDWPNLDER